MHDLSTEGMTDYVPRHSTISLLLSLICFTNRKVLPTLSKNHTIAIYSNIEV